MFDFFFLQINSVQKSSWSPKRGTYVYQSSIHTVERAEITLLGTCKKSLPGQKTRLPGPDASGNLINQKIRFFYIETMYKKFLNAEKNYFFSRSKKFRKFFRRKKSRKIFPKNPKFFLNSEKKYFFSRSKKNRNFFGKKNHEKFTRKISKIFQISKF